MVGELVGPSRLQLLMHKYRENPREKNDALRAFIYKARRASIEKAVKYNGYFVIDLAINHQIENFQFVRSLPCGALSLLTSAKPRIPLLPWDVRLNNLVSHRIRVLLAKRTVLQFLPLLPPLSFRVRAPLQ